MPRNALFFCLVLVTSFFPAPGSAQRKPVLPQIDLPHPYYFREMYLPQLTSGPSSVAWSPDAKEVVYSMGGSLWRQRLGSKRAVELTAGPGYDYEPDWSPDGKSVVYVSYQADKMELWLLDLESGRTRQLTEGGAVNLEPRWSPDGKRIVFVSTAYNRRFHIFRAEIAEGKLSNVVRLTGETRSELGRYYYSAFDTEITPAWSPDGKDIVFVSNRGHIHGSGGLWRMKAEPGAEAREIRHEETNWRARPAVSPDGSRLAYSSYLGGQFHNIWVMPAKGGDAFPLTYNAWDSTGVRWSPDGAMLAYISNNPASPATRIEFQSVPGGPMGFLEIAERQHPSPRATLDLEVVDAGGTPLPSRISVTDSAGRFWAPETAWIHADDGFDPTERPFERHYWHSQGQSSVSVPAGKFTIEVSRGLAHKPVTRTIEVHAGEEKHVELKLLTLKDAAPDAKPWMASDLHVHMNYGGTYLEGVEGVSDQARAEDLDVVNNLVVNKEQRFPDLASQGENQDTFDDERPVVLAGQEFHTSYWGHRGLVGLRGNILLPGYAGYPNTAAASLYPMNADVYDMAHRQGALVGAVHPFDAEPDPFVAPPERITDELPVDVALGKLDYLEIVGFSDHRATAAVWYRFLNLGFRIPAGAGTDATADYAAPIRGHVGFDRVYVRVPKWPPTAEDWKEGLRRGRTYATNGPLLEFSLGRAEIGDELKFEGAQAAVPFVARLRSVVPVDRLEVVCNGKVAETQKPVGDRTSAEMKGTLALAESGWCVLRASGEKAEYPVLDKYVYATTSPIYVTIGGKAPRSAEDARYFSAWIGRVTEITARYPDWNSEAEKQYVLGRLAEGKAVFDKLQ